MRRIFLSVVAVMFVAFFGACTPAMERFEPLLSELRDNIYEAKGEQYAVSIITGKREDPFVLDGHAGSIVPFTLVTVDPTASASTLSYEIVIGGTKYQGELVPHPFARTFSVDLPITATETELTITISTGGQGESLVAKSVKTDQMIGADKAIEIAERKLSGSIEHFRQGSTLNCEIYVRLVANPVDNSGGYHWYVAFVGQDQTIYAVLIEPTSMQVVAIRN